MISFNRFMGKLAKKNGMTTHRLFKKVHIDHAPYYLKKYSNNPSMTTLKKLSRFFEKPVWKIIREWEKL